MCMKRINRYYLATFVSIAVLVGIIVFGEVNNIFLSPEKDIGKTQFEDDLIVVGVSQLGSESVWRTANTKSVEAALSRENGFFAIINNARQNQENQIKAVRDFISQGVDCIVLAPVTESGWENVLEEAKVAGIPVILIDRTVDIKDASLYTTHIGSDMHMEGVRAGEWLARKTSRTDEEINIVILQGTPGSSAQIGREKGFYEIANQNPNWNILEVADADFTTTKGKEEMARLLSEYEDIDVVFSENDDMTFGAIEAINEAGLTCGIDGDITIISFDAGYEALVNVYNGYIDVDVECNPLFGDLLADVIKKIDSSQPIGKEYIVDEQVFTKDNVEEALPDREY